MMHVFHEGSARFGEPVHRLAVCRHGWRRLRAHAVLLFPHCLPPCPDIISLLAKTSQTDPVSRAHTEEFYQVTACSLEMKKLNRELRQWERIYNTVRPHQSNLTPQQFLLRGSSQRKE